MANYDFVFQCPITITADGQDKAELQAEEWFVSIQQALMVANEQLIDKRGVLIVGPASVVPAKSQSDPPS